MSWIDKRLKRYRKKFKPDLRAVKNKEITLEVKKEVKKLILEILGPKNKFLIDDVLYHFFEGDIILNTFFEIGWSLEHHLFFLDYFRTLMCYIFFVSEGAWPRQEMILHSWDRGCSSIGYSRKFIQLRNTTTLKFYDIEENFSDDEDYRVERKRRFLVKQRLFNIRTKTFILNKNSFIVKKKHVKLFKNIPGIKFKFLLDFNECDLFYLNDYRSFFEKFNFWLMWHLIIFSYSKTYKSFFWELRELLDDFLVINKFYDLDVFEQEVLNTAELILEDQEHREHIVRSMRVVLEKKRSNLAEPLPILSTDGNEEDIPTIDMYYSLIKGLEASDFLFYFNWNTNSLSMFINHLNLIDTIFYNIISNDGFLNIWADFCLFCRTKEKNFLIFMDERWKFWLSLKWRNKDLRYFFDRWGAIVEEIYLTNLKKFSLVIWYFRERELFMGAKWRSLHVILLNFLENFYKNEYSLLIFSLKIIYQFLGLHRIRWAYYGDLVYRLGIGRKFPLRFFLINKKVINKIFKQYSAFLIMVLWLKNFMRFDLKKKKKFVFNNNYFYKNIKFFF